MVRYMRVAVLFAGGKDSTYAAYTVLKNGLEVKYLITMVSRDPHSWMFHTVNIDITRHQAEAMGIEQLMLPTSGEKDRELEDLKKAIAAIRNDVDGVVAGAIASSYQKNRVDQICEELGLVSIAPLWGRDPAELLREMIGTGFEAIITSAAAQGFDESWLGRKIDEACLKDLEGLRERFGINISGEGGDYESLVLDAPFFKNRIEVVEAEKTWRGTSGYYLVKKARLVGK
jgi:ABC transporter with metal-binding/Fe-S-binding domain ATP-binding protein